MHHIGLWTREFDKSMALYVEGLGFTETFSHDPEPHRVAFLDNGDGTFIELFEYPGFIPTRTPEDFGLLSDRPYASWGEFLTARGPQFHFAVRTDDVDAAVAKACAHGGRLVIAPTDTDLQSSKGQGHWPTRWAYVEGPSGEWIEFLTITDRPLPAAG